MASKVAELYVEITAKEQWAPAMERLRAALQKEADAEAKLNMMRTGPGKQAVAETAKAEASFANTAGLIKKREEWAKLVAEQGKFGAALEVSRRKLDDMGGGMAKLAMFGGGILGAVAAASPNAVFSTFTGSMQELAAVIGETFTPAIIKVSFAIQDLADWFENLDADMKKQLGTFAVYGVAIASAAKGAAFFGSSILGVVQGLRLFVAAAGPIGVIAAALGGVLAAQAISGNPESQRALGDIGNAAMEVLKAFAEAMQPLLPIIADLAQIFGVVLKGALELLVPVIRFLAQAIRWAVDAITAVVQWFRRQILGAHADTVAGRAREVELGPAARERSDAEVRGELGRGGEGGAVSLEEIARVVSGGTRAELEWVALRARNRGESVDPAEISRLLETELRETLHRIGHGEDTEEMRARAEGVRRLLAGGEGARALVAGAGGGMDPAVIERRRREIGLLGGGVAAPDIGRPGGLPAAPAAAAAGREHRTNIQFRSEFQGVEQRWRSLMQIGGSLTPHQSHMQQIAMRQLAALLELAGYNREAAARIAGLEPGMAR